MQNLIKYLISALACLLLVGCSFIYRPNVQQGNVITPEMIAQLKPGQTQDEVRYIMGTPVLQNTFDPNRWEYVYTYKPGGKPRTEQRVSLYFVNGVLQNIQTVPTYTAEK